MPKAVTYELVAEAANYCWSKNFLSKMKIIFFNIKKKDYFKCYFQNRYFERLFRRTCLFI